MGKKYSKYHVDLTEKGVAKRTCKGVVFDSETEMKFLIEWIEPKIKSGEIIRYETQVPFVLQEGFKNFEGKKILPIKYVADYIVYFADGRRIVIDVKGQPDNTAKLKRKLFWNRFPNEEYVWYCRNIKYGDETHWITYDELEVKRKADKNQESN